MHAWGVITALVTAVTAGSRRNVTLDDKRGGTEGGGRSSANSKLTPE